MSVQHTDRPQEREVELHCDGVKLAGILGLPDHPRGIVLFAHGSGSGRFSPRNRMVAGVLQQAGIATLLFDLLTEVEAADRRRVFNIDLLAERLLCATQWVRRQPETAALPIGYFGASTGAAAALQAAAQLGSDIAAIVSRGGRPDLALAYLRKVQAPTLLIVGGADEPIIPLNQEAYELLQAPKQLVIIPGASHLFEEPGALEEVARLARDWFLQYLPQAVRAGTA
jgi:putative phosphoribosyl transferase